MARALTFTVLAPFALSAGCMTEFSALRSEPGDAGSAGAAGWSSGDASAGSSGVTGAGGDVGDAAPDGGCAAAEAELAFPSAEGFGALSRGGRGGKVLRVTNLNDSGFGSFRDAMTQTGPRTITFEVSGTITLASRITLTAAHSFLTVAGQTSPGGIQVAGSGVSFTSGFHDGIVRHLRVRPGGSLEEPAVQLYGGGGPVHDVIIDHCDIMWSRGELVSLNTAVRDVTLQWNLIAESLPPKRAALIAITWNPSDGTTYTAHHNLLTRSAGANPLSAGLEAFDFRNNLIFNWAGNGAAGFGNNSANLSAFGNFVSNVYLPGSTSDSKPFVLANGASLPSPDRGGTKIFTQANWGPLCPTGCADEWDNGYRTTDPGSLVSAAEADFRTMAPLPVQPVNTDATKNVRSIVLASVGATPTKRDPESQRVIDDVTNQASKAFRTDGGGPWPALTASAPPPDQDGDGMPGAWELAHGLDPTNPADGPSLACNGWTNLENYLNQEAGDAIP